LKSGEPVNFKGLSPKQADLLLAELDYFCMPNILPVRWHETHINRSENRVSIHDFGRKAILNSSPGFRCYTVLAMAPNTPSFQTMVRGIPGQTMVYIGYAECLALQRMDDLDMVDGWFLECGTGSLFSDNTYTPFCDRLKSDDVVAVHFNRVLSQISFSVNGRPGRTNGVAFTNVTTDQGPIFPCIQFVGICNEHGPSVSFVDY